MCFKVKAPNITPTARDLVPSTASAEPMAPEIGDNEADFARAKGKKSLRIPMIGSDTSRSSGLNV